MEIMLFAGTMIAAILGAAAGAGLGAVIDGWLTARLSKTSKAVDEGWALTSLVRGALIGTLPGLLIGGYLGFLWLTDWLATRFG